MSKGRTGIHKQGGLDVQGDKRKYQEPPQANTCIGTIFEKNITIGFTYR